MRERASGPPERSFGAVGAEGCAAVSGRTPASSGGRPARHCRVREDDRLDRQAQGPAAPALLKAPSSFPNFSMVLST